MKILSLWPSKSHPRVGIVLSKTLDLYVPTCQIKMKFLAGSLWYSYINLNTKIFTFLWSSPGMGMVLVKTLDLHLPSGQIKMKSIKESSKYESL